MRVAKTKGFLNGYIRAHVWHKMPFINLAQALHYKIIFITQNAFLVCNMHLFRAKAALIRESVRLLHLLEDRDKKNWCA
jgi:hypothetical protein